jgi:hypothetical protein
VKEFLMSNQLTHVLVPPRAAEPRGASWAADIAVGLGRIGRKVWLALEAVGRSRARRELRGLVERHAHQPEFAQALRDAMNHAAMHRDSHH